MSTVHLDYYTSVSKYWNDIGLQEKIFDIQRNGKVKFHFMDGPPFVTGHLHMGHFAVGCLKSSIVNYHRMSDHAVVDIPGYDCHGVPIETIVNREMNITTLDDLQRIGIVTFNEKCKENIRKFEGSWEPIYNKMGRWADFKNCYKTMDCQYMESVWWAFAELHKKNLVYRGYKVTPYSYLLQSPLSNFEASQNYKEKDTKTIYVKFAVKEQPNTYFLAWTTTPWTLPSNVALCVNPTFDYVYVQDGDDVYIVGKNTEANAEIKKGKIIKEVKGSDLVGINYIPPFNFLNRNSYSVIADAYVTESTGFGTNIVHIAPAFGEDDYRVCIEKHIVSLDDIPNLCPINEDCHFTNQVPDYQNLLVFDADEKIISDLKMKKLIKRIQSYRHQYPYCYRTHKPLLYRVVESFYVKVSNIKDRMIELNNTINWFPKSIGENRFNNWLENARDWCVSRSRYFGNPIPVWVNINDSRDYIVIGSVEELKSLSQSNYDFKDLHPEFINDIEIIRDGKTYRRIPDVFDCWFESGCVPYGQIHYPFENPNYFDDKAYLSDFVAEGLDQTRGWFYTLLVLSTALMDKAPFKNVICTGLILDEQGRKFSKNLGNYVDTNELIEKYGSDVLRLYLLSSSVMYAEPLKFSISSLNDLSKIMIQYVNGVNYYNEHLTNLMSKGNYDIHIRPTTNIMDQWILETVHNLGVNVCKFVDMYDVSRAIIECIGFVEDFTNWYIKFNRHRMNGISGIDEALVSLGVCRYVIQTYSVIIAPFAPFISEYSYSITKKFSTELTSKDSIHQHLFSDYFDVDADGKFITRNNFGEMFMLLKRIAKLIREARMETKTHTSHKTPIANCIVLAKDMKICEKIETVMEYIQIDANCLNIECKKLTDEVVCAFELDQKEVGRDFKKDNKIIKELFETKMRGITDDEIADIQTVKKINLGDFILEQKHFRMKFVPKNNNPNIIINGNIVLQLDFRYDDQIKYLNERKCFISYIQQTRKRLGLSPWNKIIIHVCSNHFTTDDDLAVISELTQMQVVKSNVEPTQKYVNDDASMEVDFHIEIL